MIGRYSKVINTVYTNDQKKIKIETKQKATFLFGKALKIYCGIGKNHATVIIDSIKKICEY